MRKLSLSASFRSVRPRLAYASHVKLTEFPVNLGENNFSAVDKRVNSEVSPYLADAHALESTGTLLAARSPKSGSGTHPPRIESSCLLPVEILHTLFLL